MIVNKELVLNLLGFCLRFNFFQQPLKEIGVPPLLANLISVGMALELNDLVNRNRAAIPANTKNAALFEESVDEHEIMLKNKSKELEENTIIKNMATVLAVISYSIRAGSRGAGLFLGIHRPIDIALSNFINNVTLKSSSLALTAIAFSLTEPSNFSKEFTPFTEGWRKDIASSVASLSYLGFSAKRAGEDASPTHANEQETETISNTR